ncbi:hypothetical protein BN946_scf185008.g113 [Trametes cinnabarina]|uniref:Uncharacterized protein n=1 Tax=Pycnoporus cinnabarinus TaxID=5643 RepID=A0A060SG66_PYCCI|nr:hypothetical protein BN946_scf185008.g113 [Trametes cinnabarina]
MATDTSDPTATITSTGSTASLDIRDVVSSFSGECLLSASLSLISDSGSTHSFDNVPPFPDSAKPLIFTAELGTSLFGGQYPARSKDTCTPQLLTSVPTGPRLKMMLLEPASIEVWVGSILPASNPPSPPPLEYPGSGDLVHASPAWVAEGSLFSPQQFLALLRKRLNSAEWDASSPYEDGADDSADLTLVDFSASASSASASLSDDDGPDEVSAAVLTLGPLPMPTIMVSNSTAALPLSLESSHSLQREVPLAMRRGKKLPPALSLGSGTKFDLGSPCDSYPDIPTPFLGSPTTCTPHSDLHRESKSTDMGLSAMCADLRSRLPAPPFTPTELTSSPYPALVEAVDGCDSPRSSELSDLDDDEWAFARDFVVDWRAGRGFRTELSPPPSPAGDLPYASKPESPAIDSPFSRNEFSTTSSVGDSSSSDEDEDAVQTPVDAKLTRRKTVIIQAPEPGLTMERTPSIASDSKADAALVHNLHDPVPFELPCSAAVPGAVQEDFDGDCQQAAAAGMPGSRPCSTATLRPIRGILKGKKSVRFSAVELLHEYSPSTTLPSRHSLDIAVVAPQNAEPDRLQPEPVAVARVRRIASEVHKSSPLRESHTPTPHPVRIADRRVRSHGPAPRVAADPSSFAGATMAKHPAVRAMARRPLTSPPRTPTPVHLTGSGVNGAVVGAPGLRAPSPLPLLLHEQRRAPLRSINARQSMPVVRGPDALLLVKGSRRSMLSKTESGPSSHIARRVLKSASTPPAPRREHDENAMRRSDAVTIGDESRRTGVGAPAGTVAGGKSRMSAPLRNILTKLRT